MPSTLEYGHLYKYVYFQFPLIIIIDTLLVIVKIFMEAKLNSSSYRVKYRTPKRRNTLIQLVNRTS